MSPVPEPVARVAGMMSAFRPSWCLCGGWAIDAWLGRQTRDHGDVDISVFHDDQRALFEHLAAWELIAHDARVPGNSTELWDGRLLVLPAHIHAGTDREAVSTWVSNPRAKLDDAFKLEIVIDSRYRRRWIFRDQPRISRPLHGCIRQSSWGVPTATPEVLLFYKATAYFGTGLGDERRQDQADFEALLPRLSRGQRTWLWQAISILHADHPWLNF